MELDEINLAVCVAGPFILSQNNIKLENSIFTCFSLHNRKWFPTVLKDIMMHLDQLESEGGVAILRKHTTTGFDKGETTFCEFMIYDDFRDSK
jgi:hypothetical protein